MESTGEVEVGCLVDEWMPIRMNIGSNRVRSAGPDRSRLLIISTEKGWRSVGADAHLIISVIGLCLLFIPNLVGWKISCQTGSRPTDTKFQRPGKDIYISFDTNPSKVFEGWDRKFSRYCWAG
jgi:hypothetical protein